VSPDPRDRHDRISDSDDIDTFKLKWYAHGKHVRNSLVGRKIKNYQFVVVEETHEEMLERGFDHVEDNVYTDGEGHRFHLTEDDRSLEAFLRTKDFTVDAIAMTPGVQNYHYPLMDHFEEDQDRATTPVNPVADLDQNTIRHTTNEGLESWDDSVSKVLDIKEELPGFEVADETLRMISENTEHDFYDMRSRLANIE
jgi:hypothetical protein